MTAKHRGFGSPKMTPERRKEIAAMGGKAAHKKGTAHRFSSEEARVAGKKGGVASGARAEHQKKLDELAESLKDRV